VPLAFSDLLQCKYMLHLNYFHQERLRLADRPFGHHGASVVDLSAIFRYRF
jgi:hypothetical protein